ncbi:glycosyltransferase family 2 protein [Phormidium sp. FACHB-1136]|uniref:glycosyltransferase family 2 protein n=1 Tax=Phormidium sp. FACHB-1136 TaxID=2692848 RepID=UPI001687CB72|nr:glycosyltransferase family 2 protein [Phormidium sp. FACHB-1136]MBD2428402.1 glycosyltransferase [Phormidium sp. FACHB-1136]
MPEISVIIPAYNAENTILETVSSVLVQTFLDFELIIINDGSTDNTLKCLEFFNDPRIKIFNYQNGGLATARNRGIEVSQGDFLAFLDADDLWTSDKLELQLKALKEKPEAKVAYSWTYFMDEKGEVCHTAQPILFEGNVLENLLTWNFIASGSNPLICRGAIESVGFFDTDLSGAADWDYWIRLAKDFHYVVVAKEQVFYRQSRKSMSSKIEYMEECQLNVINKFFANSTYISPSLKRKIFSNIYRYSAKLYTDRSTNQEDIRLALSKLISAFRCYPKSMISYETIRITMKVLIFSIFPFEFADYWLGKVNRARAKPRNLSS